MLRQHRTASKVSRRVAVLRLTMCTDAVRDKSPNMYTPTPLRAMPFGYVTPPYTGAGIDPSP